jgi:flagellar hook-associated protein 3 FlgL
MRVTFSMTYQKMMLNLNRLSTDSDRLSNMVASGKRLTTPQEDPLTWSQAMDVKQGLRELGTLQKNVDFATGWNQSTTNALNQFSDLLTKARETGLAANSTDSAEKRAAQVSTLDQISKQALALANTQYQDMYIFSGRSVSTAPFTEGDLDYQGDTENFEVRVGKNNRLKINMDGQEAFITDDGSNILKELAALKTALESGDLTEVQNQTGALERAQEHIGAKNSVVGSRLSSLDDRSSSLSSLEIDNKTQLSGLEDTNMAEAITELQQKQTTLQAALQVTTMLDDLSLVNFL